jgi:hypothetical protein
MRRVAPPSGAPAPEAADGLDLRALALDVTDRYGREFPDEDERYDPAIWRAWCRHDAQYLLQWGILDDRGIVNLDEQVAWLGRVLAARGFPLDRLARTLELCADVVAEQGRDGVAVRLREVAQGLR